MTTTDAGLTSLVAQLARARASAMDVAAVVRSICTAVPGVLGVGGAVLVLVDPPADVHPLTASDARAARMGEVQQRTETGPLAGALRTWRPMLTSDLTHIGPRAVAAAAAECGLLSSLVLPFDVDGERIGVLQLFGQAGRPVQAAHAEVLRPLLDVLAARFADVQALRKAAAAWSGAEPQALRKPRSAPLVPAPRDRVPTADHRDSGPGAHSTTSSPNESSTWSMPAVFPRRGRRAGSGRHSA